MSDGAVAAVDVGGTTLKGAAFSSQGDLLINRIVDTFGIAGSATASLFRLIRDLIDGAALGGETVEAIGIASPGLVDSNIGTVRYAANLGWADLPLATHLRQEFTLPVVLEHDARAAVVAERAIALPHVLNELLFIPIGTGLAAAIVVNGVVVRGATGGAGEFGHMQVVPNGDLCVCGQSGCIEAYSSGGAILRRYIQAGGVAASAADVVSRIGSDPVATHIWQEAIDALATGIVGLAAVLDPEQVVLGGGVARAGAALLDPLRSAVDRRLAWRNPPSFELSRMGTHAGLVGAALLGNDPADASVFASRAHIGLEEREQLETFERKEIA